MNDSENRAHQFNVNTGDHFNGPLIGYVNYSFQNYKINIDSKDMEAAYRKGKA